MAGLGGSPGGADCTSGAGASRAIGPEVHSRVPAAHRNTTCFVAGNLVERVSRGCGSRCRRGPTEKALGPFKKGFLAFALPFAWPFAWP